MPETPQQYTQRILAHTDNKEPLQVQQTTPKKLSTLIRKLNKKQLTRRPAPGKWSIAEILAHLADTHDSDKNIFQAFGAGAEFVDGAVYNNLSVVDNGDTLA